MSYPPNYQASKELFEELQYLDQTEADEDRKRAYAIIHDLAEAHFHEAKEYFIQGLESEDADYRYSCIDALAIHWRDTDPRIQKKLIQMAEHDPDEDVRRLACVSLGRLGDEEALSTLKRIVLKKGVESDYVVAGAYAAVFRILDIPEEIPESIETDFDTSQIDEDLIRSIEE